MARIGMWKEWGAVCGLPPFCFLTSGEGKGLGATTNGNEVMKLCLVGGVPRPWAFGVEGYCVPLVG
jgi:hypothetical protein